MDDERHARFDQLHRERRHVPIAQIGIEDRRRDLLAIQQAIDRHAPDVPLRLASWRASEPIWAAALVRAEAASLFNRQILARRLASPHAG